MCAGVPGFWESSSAHHYTTSPPLYLVLFSFFLGARDPNQGPRVWVASTFRNIQQYLFFCEGCQVLLAIPFHSWCQTPSTVTLAFRITTVIVTPIPRLLVTECCDQLPLHHTISAGTKAPGCDSASPSLLWLVDRGYGGRASRCC